jgi:hypothetical protein
MSFRKPKASAQRSAVWSDFRQRSSPLFERAGLPAHIYETEEHFQDFLMHGYLDHHQRPYAFTVNDIDPSQRDALRELVVSYLAAGFSDPGLGLFGSKEHDAIRQEALDRR